MKEHSRKLLAKALDSIEVAEGILDMNNQAREFLETAQAYLKKSK